MSVRNGLLAVLSLGPAYGAQLHAELGDRLGHRRTVNIGQVYATLERLGVQGLVRAAGVTDDGLPLYRITDDGMRQVESALVEAPDGAPDWAEMLDAVLMATSLPGADARVLLVSYRERWRAASGTADAVSTIRNTAQSRLSGRADAALSAAALAWLDGVEAELDGLSGALDADLARGYSTTRPRRGRPTA
ncbi:PadR family transcriptional regulator [Leifsonia sp. YIM 134122]|uniref:PadR family transcriptional regulator n=1 Tax=Leifsonia stereocauli TaxID=3134136 RepID=A0ABU9W1B4_9MICO